MLQCDSEAPRRDLSRSQATPGSILAPQARWLNTAAYSPCQSRLGRRGRGKYAQNFMPRLPAIPMVLGSRSPVRFK